MKRTAVWFWLIIAAQAVFLTAWAGYHEWVRQQAAVIRLSARPVDPQDMLRGDYIALGYDIGHVVVPGGAEGRGSMAPAEVWVLLEQRGRYHVAVQASRERLEPRAGQVLVRGMVQPRWNGHRADNQVTYGIESYFVPEGKGAPRAKTLEVEASVSPAHRLYIRRLLADGRPYP